MSIFSKVINIFAIFCLLYYFITKYKKRGYFISAFNLQLFKYSFALLIIPYVLERKDESWYALGIYSASSMSKWLDKSVQINTFGFIVMLMSLHFFEFNSTGQSWIEKKIDIIPRKINHSIVDLLFIIIIPAWYALVFVNNGSIPLFTASRGFYYNTSFSPVYQALNELIQLLALHYGLKFVIKKKGLCHFIISALTMLFTGGRGTLLLNVFAPICIIFIYSNKNKIFKSIKDIRKKSFKPIKIILFTLFIGVVLGVIRDGGQFHFDLLIYTIIYGNNFSDIRDGAKILRLMDIKKIDCLFGKTVLAGLMSFIPSSLSDYRITWSWGRFNTYYLSGMSNHLGMRGGNSLEAFVNFGLPGVIVFSVIQGYLYAILEKIFYNKFLLDKRNLSGNEYFIILIIMNFKDALTVSTTYSFVYVDIAFLILLILMSDILKKISNK